MTSFIGTCSQSTYEQLFDPVRKCLGEGVFVLSSWNPSWIYRRIGTLQRKLQVRTATANSDFSTRQSSFLTCCIFFSALSASVNKGLEGNACELTKMQYLIYSYDAHKLGFWCLIIYLLALKGTVVGEQVYTFDGVRYSLKRKLADGGFGSVFLAKDDAVQLSFFFSYSYR